MQITIVSQFMCQSSKVLGQVQKGKTEGVQIAISV